MTTEVVGQEPRPELPDFTKIGPYRLLQQIGEGGMGVVHLALDRSGKAVAIKVLRPHVAHDPAARTRLEREVDTLSRIRHPNVAPIIDHDVTGPLPYIVTRYIAGPPLDTVIETDGPIRGDALLKLGRGLAGALHAIHATGVIHRDVKPGNVLILDGEPILIDFGIAHIADDIRLTRTGLVMGTPGYLSPEIVEGEDVSESTDWWGWAATLGFAASGRPPFGRGNMEAVLARVVRGDADLSGIDPALLPLLEAALSTYPADRPTDSEVLRALETYAAGGLVTDVIRVVPRREQPAPTQVFAPPPTAVLPPAPRSPGGSADSGYGQGGPGYAPAGTDPAHPAPPDQYRITPRTPPTSPPLAAPPVGAPPVGGPVGAPVAGPPAFGAPGYARNPSSAAVAPAPQPSWSGESGGWDGEQNGEAAPERPLPPRPVMAGDPRIGRVTRSGTLGALAVLFVVGAAAVPGAAVIVGLLWSVIARSADRSITALVLRRHHKGVRGSDTALSVLASPIHVLTGVVATAASALIPAAVGLAGFFATLLAFNVVSPSGMSELRSPIALAIGMALFIMMAWWGPGGAGLRRGSRSVARGMAPNEMAAQVVVGLCLAAALAIAVLVATSSGLPNWWPSTREPALLDTLGAQIK